MTEATPHPSHPQVDTLTALRDMQDFVLRLNHGALTCERNHNYFGSNRPLRLLDFDVISGASRTLGLAQMLEHAGQRAPRTSGYFADIRRVLGPHSVRRVISLAMETAYTIPVGTQYELLKRKEALSHELTSRGTELVQRIEAALNSDDPIKAITTGWGTRSAWVWEELMALEPIYDEITLLEDVRNRAIPFEDILQVEEIAVARPAYQVALTALKAERSADRMKLNNHCDALNVALLAGAFRSTQKREKLVPILVSQTAAVVGLTSRQMDLELPLERSVKVFNDYVEFLISLALTRMSGGKNNLIARYAHVLASEALELSYAIQQVMTRVRDHGELAGPEWRLLANSWTRFSNNWTDVLAPATDGARLDRTSFRNALSTPRLRERLKALPQTQDRTDTALDLLEKSLAGEADRERQVLHWLAAGNAPTPAPRAETLYKLTVLSEPAACGLLLSESREGQTLEQGRDSCSKHRPFRVSVTHRFLPMVLFVFDSWGDDRISINWCYDGDFHFASGKLVELLRATSGEKPDAWCEVEHVLRESTETTQCALQKLPETLLSKLKQGGVEYMEAAVQNDAAFCDIEPVAYRELQMGLVTQLSSLNVASESTLGALGAVISTASVAPLEGDACVAILKKILHWIATLDTPKNEPTALQ